MDLSGRLKRMEKRLGARGGNVPGCRWCVGRTIRKGWCQFPADCHHMVDDPTPRPGPIPCPYCGRDMLELEVTYLRFVEEGPNGIGSLPSTVVEKPPAH